MKRASIISPSSSCYTAASSLPVLCRGFFPKPCCFHKRPGHVHLSAASAKAGGSHPTSSSPMSKMETQFVTVDPSVLPWAAWPTWSPSRPQSTPLAAATHIVDASIPGLTDEGSQGITAPSKQAAASYPSPHILNDQLLLQAASALPSSDAGMGSLRAAADLLRAGQIVAIPTETVYGLAGNALSAAAVESIYAAKCRPADNPLIVHVSSLDMLASLYEPGWRLPEVYQAVVADAWPGPLTILLPASPKVPRVATCGLSTMAVRMPAHPVARAIIALSGVPLAAPSANSSGRPSPTRALHVMEDLGGRVAMVVDAGPCQWGVESTVLDGLRTPPLILRPGSLTYEQLQKYPGMQHLQVYKRDFVDAALEAAPTTPGMKYRHYSPNAEVTLLEVSSWSGPADQLRGIAEKHLLELVTAEAGLLEHTSRQQLLQQQAQQPMSSSSAAAPTKRRPRLGVLRTSKGQGLPSGLVDNDTSGNKPTRLCAQPPETQGALANQQQEKQQQQDQGLRLDGGLDGHDLEDGCSSICLGGSSASVQGVDIVEYVLGDILAPDDVGQQLFSALRAMDAMGVDAIVVEGVMEEGAGAAVMNRLRKAATTTVHLRT